MASTLTPAMDHRLAEGMTYIFQGMQTQIPQVTVILAARMNVLRESRIRSSRVVETFL